MASNKTYSRTELEGFHTALMEHINDEIRNLGGNPDDEEGWSELSFDTGSEQPSAVASPAMNETVDEQPEAQAEESGSLPTSAADLDAEPTEDLATIRKRQWRALSGDETEPATPAIQPQAVAAPVTEDQGFDLDAFADTSELTLEDEELEAEEKNVEEADPEGLDVVELDDTPKSDDWNTMIQNSGQDTVADETGVEDELPEIDDELLADGDGLTEDGEDDDLWETPAAPVNLDTEDDTSDEAGIDDEGAIASEDEQPASTEDKPEDALLGIESSDNSADLWEIDLAPLSLENELGDPQPTTPLAEIGEDENVFMAQPVAPIVAEPELSEGLSQGNGLEDLNEIEEPSASDETEDNLLDDFQIGDGSEKEDGGDDLDELTISEDTESGDDLEELSLEEETDGGDDLDEFTIAEESEDGDELDDLPVVQETSKQELAELPIVQETSGEELEELTLEDETDGGDDLEELTIEEETDGGDDLEELTSDTDLVDGGNEKTLTDLGEDETEAFPFEEEDTADDLFQQTTPIRSEQATKTSEKPGQQLSIFDAQFDQSAEPEQESELESGSETDLLGENDPLDNTDLWIE